MDVNSITILQEECNYTEVGNKTYQFNNLTCNRLGGLRDCSKLSGYVIKLKNLTCFNCLF